MAWAHQSYIVACQCSHATCTCVYSYSRLLIMLKFELIYWACLDLECFHAQWCGAFYGLLMIDKIILLFHQHNAAHCCHQTKWKKYRRFLNSFWGLNNEMVQRRLRVRALKWNQDHPMTGYVMTAYRKWRRNKCDCQHDADYNSHRSIAMYTNNIACFRHWNCWNWCV